VQIVYFIIGFVAFILSVGFISNFAMRKLNGRINARLHGWIEGLLIGGIVLGVVAMFQPWSLATYGTGFHVLLACVLSFTVWSHVTPRTRKA
jgi:hypothetical protein